MAEVQPSPPRFLKEPNWNARVPCPSCVHQTDVQQVLNILKKCRKQTTTSLQCLMNELWFVKRLIYCNRSQHRRSCNFQKLLKVSKMVDRVFEMKLIQLQDHFLSTFPDPNSELEDEEMPSMSIIRYILDSLKHATMLLAALNSNCNEAFHLANSFLRNAEFMPFNLVASAAVARIAAVAVHLHNKLAQMHEAAMLCRRWVSGSKNADMVRSIAVIHIGVSQQPMKLKNQLETKLSKKRKAAKRLEKEVGNKKTREETNHKEEKLQKQPNLNLSEEDIIALSQPVDRLKYSLSN
eukprot:m.8273 g.8273  ORF g.8273 m.8273 type:complete len:294 (-) comp3862_c0_seq2:87-968(-)